MPRMQRPQQPQTTGEKRSRKKTLSEICIYGICILASVVTCKQFLSVWHDLSLTACADLRWNSPFPPARSTNLPWSPPNRDSVLLTSHCTQFVRRIQLCCPAHLRTKSCRCWTGVSVGSNADIQRLVQTLFFLGGLRIQRKDACASTNSYQFAINRHWKNHERLRTD